MVQILHWSEDQIRSYNLATVSALDLLSNQAGFPMMCASRSLFARTYDNRLFTFDSQLSGAADQFFELNAIDSKLYYRDFGFATTGVQQQFGGIHAEDKEVLVLLPEPSATKVHQYLSTDFGESFSYVGFYTDAAWGVPAWILVQKIIKTKGVYYALIRTRSNNYVDLFQISPGSASWTLISRNGFPNDGAFSADVFKYKERIFFFFHYPNVNIMRLDEVIGSSISTIYSQTFSSPLNHGVAVGFADPFNSRIILFAGDSSNAAFAWYTDASVTTVTQDNTLLGSVTTFGAGGTYSFIGGNFYRNDANSLYYFMVADDTNSSFQLYNWNGSSLSFEQSWSATNPSCSIIEYNPTSSYTGIKPLFFDGNINRYKFKTKRVNFSGNLVSIDPRFSLDNGYSFSAMTIDESKTGLSAAVQFNDDFTNDYYTERDSYFVLESGASDHVVANGVLRITIPTNKNHRIIKRFLLQGDFSVNIGFLGLGAGLASSGLLRVGLRAYFVGVNRKWFDTTQYAEIYALKDTTNESVYQANQRVGGTDSLSSTVVAPTAGESPAFHIDRATGVVSLYYGTSKTSISTPSSINDNRDVILELFVENTTPNTYIISFDNFNLVSGTASYIGGLSSDINWNFTVDGITSNVDVVVKVISS